MSTAIRPTATDPILPSVYIHEIPPAHLQAAADSKQLYAIIDACIASDIPAIARAAGPGRAACLYLGMAARHYGDKAPYLFRADRAFVDLMRTRFGDGSWGILLTSAAGFEKVRRHLRDLLKVDSPNGETWLFRYYDPRLLPAFVRSSTAEELNAFYGPIDAFAVIRADEATFAAYRNPAIVRASRRRPVGGRYKLSPAHVAGLRRTRFVDELIRHFDVGPQRATRDPANDDVLVQDPTGGVMRVHLGNDGLVSGVTSALGRRWTLDSREDGRLLRLRTPSGSTLALDYDAKGNVRRVERDGIERYQASHDEHGRLEVVRFPDGSSARTAYALSGPSGAADPAGVLVAAQADRLGRIERFAYDEEGRLSEAFDGAGHPSRFSYDKDGRPRALRFSDGSHEHYRYDPAGHLRQLVRADGSSLSVVCDQAGRPTRLHASDGLAEFEYDDAGRLVAARNGEIELAWCYDASGRLIEERQGDAIVGYEHGDDGLKKLVYPTGETVSFTRDTDQRLTEIIDWNGGRHVIQYAEGDGAWRILGPGGTATTSWLDPIGQPTATRVEAGGDLVFDCSYVYDSDDRLTERRHSRHGAASYSYDPEGQLVGVVRSSGVRDRYSYDGAGNRTAHNSTIATFNTLNQPLEQENDRFRHDARGDMIEREGRSGSWRYGYDGFGRLTSVQGHSGRRVTFGYDPLGRRIWKRISESGIDRVTRFIWAGEQIIREVRESVDVWTDTSAGSAESDFLYWPLSFTPLLLRQRGVVHQYHTDHNGTPYCVTSPDGSVVWDGETDPFGSFRTVTAHVHQPLRLPGHYLDEETGLHYNRHRYYDPSLGRYLSRDPLGVAGGLNLYLYAGNDPINRGDPLGLWWKTALAVVGAVAAAAVVVVAAPVLLPLAGIAAGTALAAGVTTVAASAAAGAAAFAINEALNQETFCASCIALAALKGAGVGAVAALPFLFLPTAAGLGAVAGAGAVSSLIGYAGESFVNGTPMTAQGAATAGLLGAATAGLARFLGGGGGGRPPGSINAPAMVVQPNGTIAMGAAPAIRTPGISAAQGLAMQSTGSAASGAAGASVGAASGGGGSSGGGDGQDDENGSEERQSSRPEWLRRLDEGNDFNREQAANYPHNEVMLDRPEGSAGYPRVDSYDPAAQEIVSRKHTQLGQVQPETAKGYLDELANRYPPGTRIADVPTQRVGSGHQNAGLAGEVLEGSQILEVPPQTQPVPQSVLDHADRLGITIRDSNGRTYP